MTLPGLRVGEEEVDGEELARGEEGDVAAVGAERRTDVELRRCGGGARFLPSLRGRAAPASPISGLPRSIARAGRPGCTARAPTSSQSAKSCLCGDAEGALDAVFDADRCPAARK